jgi:hypothetical protein
VANLKKLSGGGPYFRIRLGDYRIGMRVEEDVVTFVRVLPRKDIYRYFPYAQRNRRGRSRPRLPFSSRRPARNPRQRTHGATLLAIALNSPSVSGTSPRNFAQDSFGGMPEPRGESDP